MSRKNSNHTGLKVFLILLILVMIVGFLWIPLAIMVLLTGVILSAVLYTENIRASGIFGSETAWKNALVLCTATFGTAFFLLLPLAIVF